MRSVVTWCCACALLFVACNLRGEKGNGHVRTESRTVSPFHAVELSGGIEADIVVGGVQSVSITSDDNLLPLLQTSVRDGRLVVQPSRPLRPTTLHLTVTTPTLDAIRASGGIRANVSGISGPSFRVDASGGATITLSGTATQLEASLSGGVRLAADGLATQNASIDASGGVRAEVRATVALRGSVSGGVSLRVSGSPAQRSVSASGGAFVDYQ